MMLMLMLMMMWVLDVVYEVWMSLFDVVAACRCPDRVTASTVSREMAANHSRYSLECTVEKPGDWCVLC